MRDYEITVLMLPAEGKVDFMGALLGRVASLLCLMLAICALIVIFEYKYMWHVSGSEYLYLRTGLASGVLAIVSMLFIYPRYAYVVLISLATLSFPAIMGIGRSEISFSPEFFSIVAFHLSFLVYGTILRLRFFGVL